MSHASRVAVCSLAAVLAFSGCYAGSAARRAGRVVERGFDADANGPWVLISAPASLLLAGTVFAFTSVVPVGSGVDPREPAEQWYHAYPGAMRPGADVGILCHRDAATWVTGIRSPGERAWHPARHEKWHFPVCIEALPGSYELEVHYFARQHEDEREQSVSRQAESTRPSRVTWQARAGQVDVLEARIGDPGPAAGRPPQRHIPRSRALGTTWWELQESDWIAHIEPAARWSELEGPIVEQRSAWASWDGKRGR